MAQMKTKNDNRFIRRAGYLWLLGILLTVIPALASQPTVNSDLTFCPLQKVWVKRGGVSAKQADPLKDICASDASKREFSYESFRRFSPAFDNSHAEQLFFSYAKIGKRAFDGVRSDRLPQHGLSGGGGSEKSVANGQTVADKKTAAAAIEVGQSTLSAIGSGQQFSNRPDIFESKDLRRTSRPRAPPTSL
jgi:hypothetical protein